VKGAVVAVLILLGVVWYVLAGRVRTDDAQVDCHITAVAPQVPGYVVKLFINDNTRVKEGDVLVQIDPRTYQAEVEEAKANLDFAEAQANSAKLQIGLTRQTTTSSTTGASAQKESDAAEYASSQAQLEQSTTANLQLAEANVAARQATNERAQADLARYTPLLATDDVSKFQFDSVEAAARVAKRELQAAEQQRSAAQRDLQRDCIGVGRNAVVEMLSLIEPETREIQFAEGVARGPHSPTSVRCVPVNSTIEFPAGLSAPD